MWGSRDGAATSLFGAGTVEQATPAAVGLGESVVVVAHCLEICRYLVEHQVEGLQRLTHLTPHSHVQHASGKAGSPPPGFLPPCVAPPPPSSALRSAAESSLKEKTVITTEKGRPLDIAE